METIKLNEAVGELPSANDTIIVSPIALEIAETIEATIPDVAAGSTTLVATNTIAPSPSAPSIGTMPLHPHSNL